MRTKAVYNPRQWNDSDDLVSIVIRTFIVQMFACNVNEMQKMPLVSCCLSAVIFSAQTIRIF